MKDIIITNTVSLNGGDAAILMSIVKNLKAAIDEELNIYVYDDYPTSSNKYIQGLSFRKLMYWSITQEEIYKNIKNRYYRFFLRKFLVFYNLIRFSIGLFFFKKRSQFKNFFLREGEIYDLNIYEKSDIIISTGGTYLVKKYFLLPRIFDYLLSIFLKKKIVFYTQTIDDFSDHRYGKVFKYIFEKSEKIFLRDQRSFDNLLRLGVKKEKIELLPDSVFSYADTGRLGPKNNEIRKVVISVRYWPHFKKKSTKVGMGDYKSAIKKFIADLTTNRDVHVTFLSTCQGVDEYRFDDSSVAKEIIADLPEKIRTKIDVDDNFYLPEQLMNKISTYDICVSTRMHMVILSLNSGVPVIPISYEYKTDELFKGLGREEFVIDIESITSQKLEEVFDYYCAHYSKIGDEMNQFTFENFSKANKAGFYIKDLLIN